MDVTDDDDAIGDEAPAKWRTTLRVDMIVFATNLPIATAIVRIRACIVCCVFICFYMYI